MMKKYMWFSLVVLVLVLVASQVPRADANTALGGEYAPVGTGYSTTTSPLFNLPAKVSLIKSGRGSFGSVNVLETGSGGGDFEFYDATTTNINLRASSMASSSIFLGSIPNDATAREYAFDIALNNGLVMVYTGGGTVATTTINLR
jgi:hypothetical protein